MECGGGGGDYGEWKGQHSSLGAGAEGAAYAAGEGEREVGRWPKILFPFPPLHKPCDWKIYVSAFSKGDRENVVLEIECVCITSAVRERQVQSDPQINN